VITTAPIDATAATPETIRLTSAELQRYGRGRAETLGIGPEDSEALVDEMRSGRN